jgi:hypothetical protein
MSIMGITPFRHLSRAYAALLSINQIVSTLPRHHRDTLEVQMLPSEQALNRIDETLRASFVGSSVTTLSDRILALEHQIENMGESFDQRVAAALREHIYLTNERLNFTTLQHRKQKTCFQFPSKFI